MNKQTKKNVKAAIKTISDYCDSHDKNTCLDMDGNECIFIYRQDGQYDRCGLYGLFPCQFRVQEG